MSWAPIGAVVGLTYDANSDETLDVGHFLVGKTRGYSLLAVHQVRGRPHRYRLRALVCEREIPSGVDPASVHNLVWHGRNRTR